MQSGFAHLRCRKPNVRLPWHLPTLLVTTRPKNIHNTVWEQLICFGFYLFWDDITKKNNEPGALSRNSRLDLELKIYTEYNALFQLFIQNGLISNAK